VKGISCSRASEINLNDTKPALSRELHVKNLFSSSFVGPTMATHPNAYAKVEKWISDVHFQGSWFGIGIIWKDFPSSTI